jgi:hypothetical protein
MSMKICSRRRGASHRAHDEGREQHSPVRLTVCSRGITARGAAGDVFGREIESGYNSEHWIDYPDEVLTPEPIDSLARQDVYARRL